ncbi:chemotaxis protein CheC [Jeotgalibacillus campisalis]|uniref:Chemotaxis protein CheY n=1 Tax=Jeotgalibacillus campisalis TaxID=220754 RepID=A0A0C2RBQ2_9BACL|nr:chemotaxis protein CheC [Jeotgalibacillus campisalis]KIL47740.1 chemotaxis protein CheY [Jeotgalibacillus campisalis]
MIYKNNITPALFDQLTEAGNIGAGNAATSLSAILGKKIEMKVPSVKMVSFDEMIDLAGGPEKEVAGIFLRIDGEIKGSMFFILSLPQAEACVRLMTDNPSFSIYTTPLSKIGFSALQEIGNILSGSYLSAFSDFTGISLFPTVPSLCIDMAGAIISQGLFEVSQAGDQAIVIDTVLSSIGKKEILSIEAQFFVLPDPDSYDRLFESLREIQ